MRSLSGALAVAIVLIGACSSFESTPSTDPSDADAGSDAAEPDGSAAEDGAPPPDVDAEVRCDRNAPFTSIRRIDGVNTPVNEHFPRISLDERVLYFQRSTENEITIYRATRRTPADVFDTPVPVEGLPEMAAHPTLSADELEIVFTQRLNQRWWLWRARRPTPTAPFGEAEPHPVNDPMADSFTPFLSVDGTELYLARFAVTTNWDLVRSKLDADGGVGPPEALDTLNTSAWDGDPVLSPDGLSLYFYSERALPGSGKGSIWVAHRDTPTGPFRNPERIEELVFDDAYSSPGSVSADGCRLYFYSNKDRATTGLDLYVAERSP